jgi:hypothetical protein
MISSRCVFVCQCVYDVLKSPEAFHPPDLFAHALSGTSAFSLRLMSSRLPVGATPALIDSSAPPLPALTASKWVHSPHLPSSLRTITMLLSST